MSSKAKAAVNKNAARAAIAPEKITYGVGDRIAAQSLIGRQDFIAQRLQQLQQTYEQALAKLSDEQKALEQERAAWLDEMFKKANVAEDAKTVYLITPDGLIRQGK